MKGQAKGLQGNELLTVCRHLGVLVVATSYGYSGQNVIIMARNDG